MFELGVHRHLGGGPQVTRNVRVHSGDHVAGGARTARHGTAYLVEPVDAVRAVEPGSGGAVGEQLDGGEDVTD